MSDPAARAVWIGIAVGGGLIWAVLHAYATFCLRAIARKTEVKTRGWMRLAWAPFANSCLTCKIADKPGWWAILLYLPPVSLIFGVLVWMRIAEKLDKPRWLGILLIVPLVNVVVLGYLASDTLQDYVLQETLRVAALAAVALTGIIFVGMAVSLVHWGLSITQIPSIIPYLVAWSLPYALPTSFLVATVFVFGRLSGKNEVTAMKGSGINVNRVIYPLLLLGVLLTGFTFWMNHFVLPWSYRRVKEMRETLIGEVIKTVGRVQKKWEVGPYMVYVGSPGTEHRWKNIAVIRFADEFPVQTIFAEEGDCYVNEAKSLATIMLFNAQVHATEFGELGEVKNTFKVFSYAIDLEREARIYSDRPKYLGFWNLLEDRHRRRAAAAEVSDDPDVAGLVHPKSDRKRLEKVVRELYRAYSRVKDEHDRYARQCRATQDALQPAMEEQRLQQNRYRELLQSAEEAAERLRSRRKFLEQRNAELEALRKRNAPAAEIENRLDEIRELESRIDRLAKRRREKEDEITAGKEELKELETRRRTEKKKRDKAKALADAIRPDVRARKAAWEKKDRCVRKLSVLERKLRVETVFHFRNAGSLTALVFMLMGVPLGILSKRGNVLMAFAVSFFAVLAVFYPLTIIGDMLSRDGRMTPWLALWLPNIVVGSMGLVLMKWGIRR